jgi:hypothetical protein
MKSNQPATTDLGLQKLLVFSSAAAFAISFGSMLELAVTQSFTNPNLSGFYLTFLTLGIAPVVLFLAAFFLVKRRLGTVQRLFESTVVVLAGQALIMALNGLVNYLFNKLPIASGDMFGSFGIPIVTTFFALLVTIAYVFRLRRAGRW